MTTPNSPLLPSHLQLYARSVARDGFLHPPRLPQRIAQVIIRLREHGFPLYGVLVGGDRLV